jgi:hypothetical protein
MDLIELQQVLDAAPEVQTHRPTFLQIAGFPHYENVCSNILKFYFDPANKIHGLNDLLLKSLFQLIPGAAELSTNEHIEVKREITTTTGRIDLVINATTWVVAIENKVKHLLNNDLNEYSTFLNSKYPNKKIFKIVLSIREEVPAPKSGFINITYDKYIKSIEENDKTELYHRTSDYGIFFRHFILSVKHFYQSIYMTTEEITFLIKNEDNIAAVNELERRLNLYIRERAYNILRAITCDSKIEKGVYDNYDLYFVYSDGKLEYKIDCPIEKTGIYITLCTHRNNEADLDTLKMVDIFKDKNISDYRIEGKLILDGPIDFFISDDELVEKLNSYLKSFKVSE